MKTNDRYAIILFGSLVGSFAYNLFQFINNNSEKSAHALATLSIVFLTAIVASLIIPE